MPSLASPMGVLKEEPPDRSHSRAFLAARTPLTASMWRAVLWGADKGGRFLRWIASDLRPVFIVLLALGAVFLRARDLDWEALSAAGAGTLLALVPSFSRARGRVM